MPVSRIAFALGDLRSEIVKLLPEDVEMVVDVHMDVPTFTAVVKELEHHHGARLQRDDRWRGPGLAARYAGMRLIMEPPGNRR